MSQEVTDFEELTAPITLDIYLYVCVYIHT